MKTVLFTVCCSVFAFVLVAAAPPAGAAHAPDPLVKLTADFPRQTVINVQHGRHLKTVRFNTTITNQSRSDLTLTAGTPCEVRNWRILDAAGKELLRMKKEGKCPQLVVKLPLAAGESRKSSAEVLLDSDRLTDDEDYTLEYTFFGYTAQNKFQVLIFNGDR